MQTCPHTPVPLAEAIGKFGLVLSAALLATTAVGSSHREAPFITSAPKVDATDLYMFRSYEQGREGFVTILANYQPFQDPQGGPNFYMFDPNALYEINLDNNGDGKEDMTFQFRFKNTSKMQALSVGDKQVKIPLINSGPISQVNDPAINVRETYTVNLVRGGRRQGVTGQCMPGNGSGGTEFDKPIDNIGDKTFGGPGKYAAYADKHVQQIMIPGCDTPGRVFAGQRKESFYIAVGLTFDLFNLNPLGPEAGGNNNDLEGKNISTLALELPISCLKSGDEPVIGAWTTASLRQGRLLNGAPGTGMSSSVNGGAWTQVSRLGMPLVNEVIIGIDDKDKFNASKPIDDPKNFADYVTNPVLPTLIQSLFPTARAPTNFPRTDLLTVFLKGIQGLNQPKNVAPAEMLRLNTSTSVTAPASQNPLGVAAGDAAGFPNGRRPGDDVVDLSLRVAMGALCVLTGDADALKVGCKPSDAPSGGLPFTDGVRKNASNYAAKFPYLAAPLQGNLNPPSAPGTTLP